MPDDMELMVWLSPLHGALRWSLLFPKVEVKAQRALVTPQDCHWCNLMPVLGAVQ